jgi:hypothetical protein
MAARHYFALLMAVGTVIAVAPLPRRRVHRGRGVRESQPAFGSRAVTSQHAAGGTAGRVGIGRVHRGGLSALSRRHVRVAGASALVIVVSVFGALPAQWREGLIAPRFSREEIPEYWLDAARALDAATAAFSNCPASTSPHIAGATRSTRSRLVWSTGR